MTVLFTAVLSFVFVVQVLGQGDYVGRSRDAVIGVPLNHNPKPFDMNQIPKVIDPFNNGIEILQSSGGFGMEPDYLKNIIGNTILGRQIIGGQDGFPRHGGTLNPDGIVKGWGADPNVPAIQEVRAWQDPLNGFNFPNNYMGQDLYFDQSLNRYAIKNPGHVAVKTGGVNAGKDSIGQAEHIMFKESNHAVQKAVDGVGPISGVGMNNEYIKAGSFGPGMVDQKGGIIGGNFGSINHDIAKASTGVFPWAGTHVGLSNSGLVSVGQDGMIPPVIQHNIGKAAMSVDSVIGHNIAKSAGGPDGLGYINPTGIIGEKMGVDTIGTNPFSGQMNPMFGTVGSGSSGQMNPMFGAVGSGSLVHNVNKAGFTGVASIGNDPLAANLGHDIAKQLAGKASALIDTGSHGGVSFGDPFANAAAHGLAKEAVHVAGKTLGIASSGIIGASAGMNIIGKAPAVGTLPIVKPITGYGRRI